MPHTTTRDPSRRRRKPPRRRYQEILEAAARVFHEKGYESTSIQDIADEIGILKGSVYYYITSKEDLLYQILFSVHEEALANIARAETLEGDPLQKIRAFVTFHITFNADNLVKMGVFFQDFRSLRDERRRAIIAERDRYDRFLRGLIKQGQDEGIVCPEVDPKLAALGILGMTNWIYQWYRPAGECSSVEVANAFADAVVASLSCTPATHVPGHRTHLAAFAPA